MDNTSNLPKNIQIEFDTQGAPLPLRMILATRSGRMIRELPINHVKFKDNLGSGSEISFDVYKERCLTTSGEIDIDFWKHVDSLRLGYCPEFDMWYELDVEFTDSSETVKAVTATSLGEAELSNAKVYGIEINTESDIARDDYEPTVLYNEDNASVSLIDRLLYKSPHYKVGHVDDTIKNLQRTFTFNDKTVYDAFQEVAQEIGCLFRFECRRSTEAGDIKEYKNPVYYTEEKVLICTLNGRTYTKANDGGAYAAYCEHNGYTGVILVSENKDAVDYKTSYDGTVFHFTNTVPFKGKTFFISGFAYSMSGRFTSSGGFATKLPNSYSSITDAALVLLNTVYAKPSRVIAGSAIKNNVIRTINVYDLWNTCMACGNRGEFMEVCDQCGSTNIKKGYGEDTSVYVDKDNLAKEVVFSTDIGSIKNCFRLTAGDDLMTAAIISCNPNGSQYLWYIPEYMQEDMTDELKQRLNEYNDLYDYYQNDHVMIVTKIIPEE